METFRNVAMIALLVLGALLTIAVLMQHGKSYGLSGTIAGGAETFFGKEKGSRIDKILARFTTVMGILFVLIVLLLYIVQGNDNRAVSKNQGFGAMLDSISETQK